MKANTLLTAALVLASAAAAQAQITIGYAPLPESQPAAAPAASRFVQTGAGLTGAPATVAERYTAQRPAPPVAPTTAPVTYPVGPPITAQQPTPASSYLPAAATTSYAPATQAYFAPAVASSTPSYPVIQAQYTTVPAGNGYAVAPGAAPAASIAPTLAPQASGQAYLGQTYPVQQVAYDPCACTCQPVGYAPSIQYVPTSGYVPNTNPAYAYTPAAVTGTAAVPRYAWQPLLPLRSLPDEYFVGQGLLGQPKVYAEGEPIRNFFRYILP